MLSERYNLNLFKNGLLHRCFLNATISTSSSTDSCVDAFGTLQSWSLQVWTPALMLPEHYNLDCFKNGLLCQCFLNATILASSRMDSGFETSLKTKILAFSRVNHYLSSFLLPSLSMAFISHMSFSYPLPWVAQVNFSNKKKKIIGTGGDLIFWTIRKQG